MKKTIVIMAILLVSLSLFGIEWTPDKTIHTGVSWSLNTSSYVLLKYYTNQKPAIIAAESFAITMGLGVIKEMIDPNFNKYDILTNDIGWGLSAIPLAILEPFEVYYNPKQIGLLYRF